VSRATTDTASNLDNDSTARRMGWAHCLRTIAVMGFASPYVFGLWLSLGTSPLRRYRGSEAQYLTWFFLSLAIWAVAFPVVVSAFRPVGNGPIMSCVSVMAGLLLLGLGLNTGIDLPSTVPALGAALYTVANIPRSHMVHSATK
jgi:hypothetical protein